MLYANTDALIHRSQLSCIPSPLIHNIVMRVLWKHATGFGEESFGGVVCSMLYLEFGEQFSPQVVNKFLTFIRVLLIWEPIDVEMLIHQYLGLSAHCLI